jgi:hypothetical protein
MREMRVVTYDGSGQAVHPDYLTPIRPWSHRPRFLALTPYAFSNRTLENPALYSGSNGFDWTVASGTPNPLAFPKSGYLSDPDIVYANFRNELFLYYRQTTPDSDYIHLIRSANGVQWGDPVAITTGRRDAILSPAVVRMSSSDWRMWSVNSGRDGCAGPSTTIELRRSADGLTWGPPSPVKMDLGVRFLWHLDVQYIPRTREFWAVGPVKTAGGCVTEAISLLRSSDGVNWIPVAHDVFVRGVIPEFRDIVYRTTFAYDAADDALTFWLSGARVKDTDFVWSTAAVRIPRVQVFDPIRYSSARVRGSDEDRAWRAYLDSIFIPPHE